MTQERIGFIGVGNMGAPMSANIAKAGMSVTIYDTNQALAASHARDIGAAFAPTLKDLAERSDIIVTMLPTGAIVRAVMLDAEGDGLAAHLAPGALLIDMSSSDPVGTRKLGADLAERGIGLVDAPVSGAVPRARTGTLAIMIGSDTPELTKRAKAVLAAMGDRLFETGPLGSGHAMKALNNYVAAAGFAAASEALILGERFGLDPRIALDILNVSTGRNFSTESTIKSQVLSGDFASGFALALLTKDVKIAADLAGELEASLPLVAATSKWWLKACDEMGGEKDHTAAFTAWKRTAAAR